MSFEEIMYHVKKNQSEKHWLENKPQKLRPSKNIEKNTEKNTEKFTEKKYRKIFLYFFL